VSTATATDWEAAISGLLAELSSVQTELLETLDRKRAALAAANLEQLAELQPQAEALVQRLEQCQRRRAELLEQARREGLPGASVSKLATRVSGGKGGKLGQQVKQSAARMRLLQHHSLANWVLAQRSLLHVSQLLEIVATGGRLQPTYGDTEAVQAGGGLVNEQA
jgi:flagellar biosynthesis/type III secretory pathway chaperone